MSTAHVRGATASRTLRQSNGGWLRPAPTLAALTLTSALLVGCTFLGTVTIALSEGRRLNHLVSFNMIAAMTATYGIGQIVGPLVAGTLYDRSGSFNPSLSAATIALLAAAALVAAGAGRASKVGS